LDASHILEEMSISGTSTELGFWRKVLSKEQEQRRLHETSPPGSWPLREAKLKECRQLPHYYARGFPNERNNCSGGVTGCVAPDPTAPLWPPPRQMGSTCGSLRQRPPAINAAALSARANSASGGGTLGRAGGATMQLPLSARGSAAACTPASSNRTPSACSGNRSPGI